MLSEVAAVVKLTKPRGPTTAAAAAAAAAAAGGAADAMRGETRFTPPCLVQIGRREAEPALGPDGLSSASTPPLR
jgi:hypothetical protein